MNAGMIGKCPDLEQLNPAVEVIQDYDLLQFRDNRTGLHIVSSFNLTPGTIRRLHDEHRRLLVDLGFFGDIPLSKLRSMQRPFRRGWQSEVREAALQSLAEFVVASVPYYRERYQVAENIKLSTLPITTKPELRGSLLALLADEKRLGPLTWASTSGTTTERVQVPVDMELDRVPPYYESIWGLSHGDKVPKTAVLTSPRCTAAECHLGKAAMSERIRWGNTLYLNSTPDLFGASDDLIQNFVEEMWEFRPEFLLVNPVYLQFFCGRAADLNLRLPPVELVLSSFQYLSEVQRRSIAEMLGAPVYNTYTATELTGCQVGVECNHGHWHVREDHTILEIVDESGAPSATIGSILVTTTANRTLPLLRYRIGDFGRLLDVDCGCALSDWQCFEFHGRESESLTIRGERVTTKQFDDVVSILPWIAFYQCTQAQDANTLLIEVIPASGVSADSQRLSRLVDEAFGCGVALRLVSRLTAADSGKFPLLRRR